MSAILKFDFQKRKQLRFFWSKLPKLHKKDPISHVTITFFPKTRGNKNKQWWTHYTPVKAQDPAEFCHPSCDMKFANPREKFESLFFKQTTQKT